MQDEHSITTDDLAYLDIPAPIGRPPHPRSIQGLLALAGALAPARWAAQRRLARAISAVNGSDAAVVAPVRRGRETGFVVLGGDGRVSVVEPAGRDLEPRAIDAVALVKGARGDAALLLRTGDRDVCLTGLGPMARFCAALQRDGVPIRFIATDEEYARLFARMDALDSARRAALRTWLEPDEFVTELIDGVRVERQAEPSRSVTIVATPGRVAVLGGGESRARPGVGLLSFRCVRRFVLEEMPAGAAVPYRLHIEGDGDDEGVTLALAEDHAAILFPLVSSRAPLEVRAAARSHTPSELHPQSEIEGVGA